MKRVRLTLGIVEKIGSTTQGECFPRDKIGQKSKKLKKPLFRCAKKAENREKSF
jgi:hypothetical protein